MTGVAMQNSALKSRPWEISTGVFLVVLGASCPVESTQQDDNYATQTVGNFNHLKSVSSTSNDVKSYLSGWNTNQQQYPNWYHDLTKRLTHLSKKKDGWKGLDSNAATPPALKHAAEMLTKLARDGVDRRPSIGLDYEGTLSFSWLDDIVSIDLTVFEDGTYSFFASNKEISAHSDEAKLEDPLDNRLLSVLLS